MATAHDNWIQGIRSIAQSDAMKLVKTIAVKDYSTSKALTLELSTVPIKNFKNDENVSPHIVQALAVQLARHWNKQNRYAYISAAVLEEFLDISPLTRKRATRSLRKLGFFGVVEGYINTNAQEAFTNCYYPLFDSQSREAFSTRINSEHDKWQATTDVSPDTPLPVVEGTVDDLPF